MAEYTSKYNLKKPAPEDFADIADINGNMDIIDETLGKKADLDDNGKIPAEQLGISADPAGTAENKVNLHDGSPTAHPDIREMVKTAQTSAEQALNKSTLLTDKTAAVLGLGDGATVNDALAMLGGKINEMYPKCAFRREIIMGSQTWTAPIDGYYRITVIGRGGNGGNGGAGSGNSCGSGGGGGGGGGGYIVSKTLELTPGQQYTITIGAGGTGGANHGSNGGNGGTTSFGSLLSANGGGGGGGASGAGTDANPAVAGAGGAGGTKGSNGTQNANYDIAGGAGGTGLASKVKTIYTGAGGVSRTGSTSGNGTNPKQYGGGGQGGKTYRGSIGYTTEGANGAAGGCILEYRVIKA